MTTTDISAEELDQIYQFAIQLGKDAGKMLLEGLEARRSSHLGGSKNSGGTADSVEKMNAVDIVTKTDTDVESFIHGRISCAYPTHAFIGEETYSQGSSRTYLVRPDTPTWIVDPLDGTVNFTHGFPMFCVSIALVHNERAVIGVIHAPLLQQLFSACRSRGAWLNETTRLPYLGGSVGPLPASAPARCIFGCEWGKDRSERAGGNLRRKVDSFVAMAAERGGGGGMCHGVRSLGSATLDLAYTAMGSVDIWWEGGCWEWDVAAGICLVQEAGGLVTSANPPPATTGSADLPADERDWDAVPVDDVKLGSRLYLAIRPATDAADGSETARQSQERTVREVWKRVVRLDYSRPGV